MRTITIYIGDDNHFSVHEDERVADKLGWDEMLGQIASMTHPRLDGSGPFDVHIDTYMDRMEHSRIRRLQRQARR